MRVLWVGDAVAATGFSKCTHAVCDELHASGHEVHVLGINYYGSPHAYPYSIYPCFDPLDGGHDAYGAGRLPRMIERLKPDVVVLLNDPWNVRGYEESIDAYNKARARFNVAPITIPPIVAWLAVDAKNHKGEELNNLSHVVTWTEFGKRELAAGGCKVSTSVVPLGVDTSIFYPRDRQESRARLDAMRMDKETGNPVKIEFTDDDYIVGVVGRNQPRKRLDLAVSYFAEWTRRYKLSPNSHDYRAANVWLYLHIAPTGEDGCDLRQLIKYHGLSGRVILAEPHVGMGDPESCIPYVYSAFDCLLSTSQAEGWNLPALEAMACGCPVLAPDWAALSSSEGGWPGDSILHLPCTSTALTAPLGARPYTIGGVPDKEATVHALQRLYTFPDMRRLLRDRGLLLASRSSWKQTGVMMREVLERVVDKSNAAKQAVDNGLNLCVPVLRRYDLLRKLLLSTEKSSKRPDRVYIIDNGMNAEKLAEAVDGITLPITIETPSDAPYGLAYSWNWFIRQTTGQARIISNDDIEFAPDSIRRMLETTEDLVFAAGIGFSCFVIRDSCVGKIGLFDEELSPGFAYFEDCDYMYRKDEYNKQEANASDPVTMRDVFDTGIIHLRNGTQRDMDDPQEISRYKQRYYIAQENFIRKWGSLPDGLRRMSLEEMGGVDEDERTGTDG